MGGTLRDWLGVRSEGRLDDAKAGVPWGLDPQLRALEGRGRGWTGGLVGGAWVRGRAGPAGRQAGRRGLKVREGQEERARMGQRGL